MSERPEQELIAKMRAEALKFSTTLRNGDEVMVRSWPLGILINGWADELSALLEGRQTRDKEQGSTRVDAIGTPTAIDTAGSTEGHS